MSAVETNIIPLSGRAEPRRTIRSFRAAGDYRNAVLPITATARLEQRGYVILYRHNVVNYCPGCVKSHWIIGNRSAECAFCATALDLQRLA